LAKQYRPYFFLPLVIIVAAMALPLWAEEADTTGDRQGALTRYQAGARLGVWYNLGDNPPEADTANTFTTNFHDASFFFEGFGAMRLTSMLMGELSLGIANRGSVTFDVDGRSNIGNLLMYAILVQLKFYPMASANSKLQPYVTGGGGFYYGRRTVQFTNTYPYYPGLDEKSATDFNYVLGGGFDYKVASMVALDFNVKYMPAYFGGDGLMTVNDYGALAFSIGAKYLTSGSSKDKESRRRNR